MRVKLVWADIDCLVAYFPWTPDCGGDFLIVDHSLVTTAPGALAR